MLGYDTFLASKAIRQHPILSMLMALAIALGIGTFMTIVTISYSIGKNPLPQKNDFLYRVQLDAGNPDRQSNDPRSRPDQLTYTDATALMRTSAAWRQSAMFGVQGVVRPEREALHPFEVSGRAVYSDFFEMFDAPFEYGGTWSTDSDENSERVVVLSKDTNERLFGDQGSVGEHISLNDELFRIVGVLDEWDLVPRIYDLSFSPPEETFLPFSTAVEMEFRRVGSTNCWQPSPPGREGFLASECVWIQFWAELEDSSKRDTYLSFLDSYAMEQKQFGRFQRPLNNAIHTIDEWIAYEREDDGGLTIFAIIALLFFIVCLINTIGLLLAKFLSRTRELAIHRALGASRRALFWRFLVEAGCIGLAGGLLGLAFTWLGLLGIRVLLRGQDGALHLTQLDPLLTVVTLLLGIVTSVLTALYPAWRGSRDTPGVLLKGL